MIISPLIRAPTFHSGILQITQLRRREVSRAREHVANLSRTRREGKRIAAKGMGTEEATRKSVAVSQATTERRPILISELLPFYFNFLAFKPSKRVYLRNIIAGDRCESPAVRVGQGEKTKGEGVRGKGEGGRGREKGEGKRIRRRTVGRRRAEKVEVPALINLRT